MYNSYFIDFETFNAELILEMHTLGCLVHKKACLELSELESASELLTENKLKSSFSLFKQAASIFNYIASDLCKHSHWKHKTIRIPEISVLGNYVYSKISQTHGMMAAFEKGLNDPNVRTDFLAKVAKKVYENLNEMVNPGNLVGQFLKQANAEYSELVQPNFVNYVLFT
jgi:hypothetical protein